MHILASVRPVYAISGLLVGLLVGLTGVGGGSLMTPLLVLVFGVHPATAVGTDLLYASATKTVGSAVHGAKGSVDWGLVGFLAAGSAPAAAVTLLVLSRLGASGRPISHLITVSLAVALIATAAAMLLRDRLSAWAQTRGPPLSPARRRLATVGLGAVVGALVALSSVGAGAIGITVLLILYPDLSARRLVGSDIAHAVPLTLIAGLGHWLIGGVDLALLGSLLVGSIPGVVAGSLASSRVPDRVLRPVIATALALVGVRLFF